MKKMVIVLTLAVLVIGISGCASKNRAYETSLFDSDWTYTPDVKENFNQGINYIADQLQRNSVLNKGDKIAIASFVDLHQLNKTTHFGRKMSESMFNELHTRGFRLIDIRGTKTIRVNAGGEFFITRDIKLLNNKRVENSYILVGTYSKFGDGILLNVRMIDNLTGDVVSTARAIIEVDDCDVYENCEKEVIIQKRTIGISDAGCSYVDCPSNCVTGDCYRDIEVLSKPKELKNKQIECITNCK